MPSGRRRHLGRKFFRRPQGRVEEGAFDILFDVSASAYLTSAVQAAAEPPGERADPCGDNQ